MRAQFIYEKLDFERGQEPLDSLKIGRVKEREEVLIYSKIKRAMTEIMETLKIPISKLKDLTTENKIDFRFHYEIWDYCIQYDKNFTDPVFDYTYHVAYFGSPGMENSDILDYGTLEQCINKLNHWLNLRHH